LGSLADPLLLAARAALGLASSAPPPAQGGHLGDAATPGAAWAYGGLPATTGEFKERCDGGAY
jgi:hypothetical protein